MSTDNLLDRVVVDPIKGIVYHKAKEYNGDSSDRHVKKWNTQHAGKVAGTKTANGYMLACLHYRHVLVHRLIWEYVHGSIPVGMELDHINGDRLDNRITNLRLATRAQNMQNVPNRRGQAALRGTKRVSGSKTWSMCISVNRKIIHRSGYLTKGLAAVAYAKASLRYHGKFAWCYKPTKNNHNSIR